VPEVPGVAIPILERGAEMSIIGILSSNFFPANAAQNPQNIPSSFQYIRTEFQQLGQDLQAGNLSQAQQDYATLTQNLPGLNQNSANPLVQAFTRLGKDLLSGYLQAAQQDYTTVQLDAQQNASQARGHHHHHHAAISPDSSSLSQQTSPIVQAFSQLAQDLQAGNLQGAQSAFAILQNDLQQIGGFLTAGSNGASSPAAQVAAGGLNVTV
jgi:outer membrane protein assembly factor BamD (BamD/ComL family)